MREMRHRHRLRGSDRTGLRHQRPVRRMHGEQTLYRRSRDLRHDYQPVYGMRQAQRLRRRMSDMHERRLHSAQEPGRSRRLRWHMRQHRRVQEQARPDLPGRHRLRGRDTLCRRLLLRQGLHGILSGL